MALSHRDCELEGSQEGGGGCWSGGQREQAGVGRTGRRFWCSLSAGFLQPPLQLPADCGAVHWKEVLSSPTTRDLAQGTKTCAAPRGRKTKESPVRDSVRLTSHKAPAGRKAQGRARGRERKGVQGTPMYNKLHSPVNKQLSSAPSQLALFLNLRILHPESPTCQTSCQGRARA